MHEALYRALRRARPDQQDQRKGRGDAVLFRARRTARRGVGIVFSSGRKPRQIVPSKLLRQWALEMSGIPEWLYAESRDTVGDGAETIALLLPNNN